MKLNIYVEQEDTLFNSDISNLLQIHHETVEYCVLFIINIKFQDGTFVSYFISRSYWSDFGQITLVSLVAHILVGSLGSVMVGKVDQLWNRAVEEDFVLIHEAIEDLHVVP